jgi:hypothetical protein
MTTKVQGGDSRRGEEGEKKHFWIRYVYCAKCHFVIIFLLRRKDIMIN